MATGQTAALEHINSNPVVLVNGSHDQENGLANTSVTYDVASQLKPRATSTDAVPITAATPTHSLPMRKRKSAGPSMFENDVAAADPKKAKEVSAGAPFVKQNATVLDANDISRTPPMTMTTADLPPLKRPPMPKAREIRLEQNRKAARESRRRKKVMIEELQRSVIFFSRANATLKQQNDELQRILLQSQAAVRGISNKQDEAQTAVSATPAAPAAPIPHPVPSTDVTPTPQTEPETTTSEASVPQPSTPTAPNPNTSKTQVGTTPTAEAGNVATPDATKITIPDAAAAAALLAAAHSAVPSAAAAQASFVPFFQAMAMNPATIMTTPTNPAYAMQQQLAAAHFFAAAANPVVFQQQQVAIQQLQQQAAVAWQNAAANTARQSNVTAPSNEPVVSNQGLNLPATPVKQPEKQTP